MQQLSNFSTYSTGILQARAYRNLRYFMTRTLKKHGLTSAEWSVLGVVSDATKSGGIRVSDIAKMLDVQTSFITNLVKGLMKEGLTDYAYDEDDGRVRLVVGTDKAHAEVDQIEKNLRKEMKAWLGDIRPEELVQYITVLQKISGKTLPAEDKAKK